MNFVVLMAVCHMIWEIRQMIPKGYVTCFRNTQMESIQYLVFNLLFKILQSIENRKNTDEVCEKRPFIIYLWF